MIRVSVWFTTAGAMRTYVCSPSCMISTLPLHPGRIRSPSCTFVSEPLDLAGLAAAALGAMDALAGASFAGLAASLAGLAGLPAFAAVASLLALGFFSAAAPPQPRSKGSSGEPRSAHGKCDAAAAVMEMRDDDWG
jgi:hypothetical protein